MYRFACWPGHTDFPCQLRIPNDLKPDVMNYSIRNATSSDLEPVLALNESVVPHVNSLMLSDLQDFLVKAAYFRVAVDDDGQILSFLIGLAPDTEYDSPNFLWFCRHYRHFAYVDRVAVAQQARRRGIAEALYDDFATFALGWARRMSCEVNLRPANPGSLAFHQRMGFTQVGAQEIHNGSKKVAMLIREMNTQETV